MVPAMLATRRITVYGRQVTEEIMADLVGNGKESTAWRAPIISASDSGVGVGVGVHA